MAMNTSVHQRLLHLVQQRQAAQTPTISTATTSSSSGSATASAHVAPAAAAESAALPAAGAFSSAASATAAAAAFCTAAATFSPAAAANDRPTTACAAAAGEPRSSGLLFALSTKFSNFFLQRLPDALLAEFNNMKRQIAELQAAIPTRPPDDSSPADRPRNSQPEVNGSAGPAAPSAPLQQQQLRLEPDRILPHRNGRLSTDPSPTGTPAALGSRAASSASSAAFSIFEALAVGDWRYVFQQMLEVESMAALKQGAELYFSEQKAYSADHVHNLMTALEMFDNLNRPLHTSREAV
ncbi:hypothetical protein DFJ73DRAFT_570081 [Zopfochytrium polystomum]|nr:hypothetical protein DFJ73DRAFT_570081 [Zopfochytrium polystomum]